MDTIPEVPLEMTLPWADEVESLSDVLFDNASAIHEDEDDDYVVDDSNLKDNNNHNAYKRNNFKCNLGKLKRGKLDNTYIYPKKYVPKMNKMPLCVMVNTHSDNVPNEIFLKNDIHSEIYSGNEIEYVKYIYEYLGLGALDKKSLLPNDAFELLMFTNMRSIRMKLDLIFNSTLVSLNSDYVKMMLCYVRTILASDKMRCHSHGVGIVMRRAIVSFDQNESRIANVVLIYGDFEKECYRCQRMLMMYMIFTCWNGYETALTHPSLQEFSEYISTRSESPIVAKARISDMLSSIIVQILMMILEYEVNGRNKSAVHVMEIMKNKKVMERGERTCNKAVATKILSLLLATEHRDEFELTAVKYCDSRAKKLVITADIDNATLNRNADGIFFHKILLYAFMLHKPLFNRLGVTDISMIKYDASEENCVNIPVNTKHIAMRTNHVIVRDDMSCKVEHIKKHREYAATTVFIEIAIAFVGYDDDEDHAKKLKQKICDVLMAGTGAVQTRRRPTAGDARYGYTFNRAADINVNILLERMKLLCTQALYFKSKLYESMRVHAAHVIGKRRDDAYISGNICMCVPKPNGDLLRMSSQVPKIM